METLVHEVYTKLRVLRPRKCKTSPDEDHGHRCVDASRICDGLLDCVDASDEANCGTAGGAAETSSSRVL